MDSGATGLFLDDKYRGDDHQEINHGIEVEVADQRTITSTSTDVVPFTDLLPIETRTCNKFKDLSHSLIGVGVICDAGNRVIFERTGAAVESEATGDTIMHGIRHPHSRLYMVSVPRSTVRRLGPSAAVPRVPQTAALARVRRLPRVPPTTELARVTGALHRAFNAYEVQSIPDLINFYHRTCCNIPKSTWIQAINKHYFATWPGLTADRVRKYCTAKPETAMGHLKRIRSNVRSTRTKTRRIGTFLYDPTDLKSLIGVDFTGRYPVTSQRGHKYILVLYCYDTNYINAIPVRSRTTKDYVAAFTTMYNELASKGLEAQLVRLDNEVSKQLIEHFTHCKLKVQMVTAGMHRNNPAERASDPNIEGSI